MIVLGRKLYQLFLGGLDMESARFEELPEYKQKNWEQTAQFFRKHVLDTEPSTLVPVEPLSDEEQSKCRPFDSYAEDNPGKPHVLLSIIRKRFPKPEPARKTARELGASLKQSMPWDSFLETVDELARRAEAGEP